MKDKLKNVEIKYFMLPVIVLIVFFVIAINITINTRVRERYNIFENNSIEIAQSYIYAFNFSHEAYDTLNKVIDDKLTLASKTISLIAAQKYYEVLSDLAKDLNIDEISIYNSEGRILYSNIEEYIGWKTNEGHPVYDFMTSGQNFLIEDIRQDTISGKYKKFAYVRNPDNSFIQIGELAQNITTLLGKVNYQKLVDIIAKDENILEVTLLNIDNGVLAASSPDPDLTVIEYRPDNEREHVFTHNEDYITGVIPIYHNREKHGTLIVKWAAAQINADVRRVVVNGLLQLIVIFSIMMIIFYYAYRKNKSNIQTAFYDKLTGLPNNEYLLEYLQEYILDHDKKKAILLVNIRGFRNLNLTYGFSYINNMLVQLTNRINQLLSLKQKLFRFGADRFAIVAENYSDKIELEILAKRIIKTLAEPFEALSESGQVSPEIGIVEIRDENMSVDRIMQDAMLALSNIKDTMVFPVLFYEDIMADVIHREDRIEKALRSVINGSDKNRFYLDFQPKLDFGTNNITGFEALARMYTEELGNISPVEFIDIAEKRQLIYDLGLLILSKACCFMKDLIELGYNDLGIAVNISGLQLLRDEFIRNVSEIIKSCDIPANHIEIEITESILLENYEFVNTKLKTLKEMGILISIDDFGTGFSSLSRLKELNIDWIKLDRYFVNCISREEEENIITADIISMAHRLGLRVIAEGVETQEQIDYLKKHDCDRIQGYIISKPVNAEESLNFLRNSNSI